MNVFSSVVNEVHRAGTFLRVKLRSVYGGGAITPTGECSCRTVSALHQSRLTNSSSPQPRREKQIAFVWGKITTVIDIINRQEFLNIIKSECKTSLSNDRAHLLQSLSSKVEEYLAASLYASTSSAMSLLRTWCASVICTDRHRDVTQRKIAHVYYHVICCSITICHVRINNNNNNNNIP